MIIIFEHQRGAEEELEKIGINKDFIITVEPNRSWHSTKKEYINNVRVSWQEGAKTREIEIYNKNLEEVCNRINRGEFVRIDTR